MSTTIEWTRWLQLPKDPDPVDPKMAFIPGKPDSWRHWWGKAYLGHVCEAKCTRIRIVDGEAIMRLRWYDSIRREARQKSVRWSMRYELLGSTVPLRKRVELAMAEFKKDLFDEVKHHFN